MSGTQRENAREGTTEEASPRDTSDLSERERERVCERRRRLEFTAPKPRDWARSRTVGKLPRWGFGALVKGWSLLCCCQGLSRTKNGDRCDALRRLEERGTGVGASAAAADAREVRNACAGNVEATRALRESDGCGTLLRLMRDAATSGGKTSEEEEEGRMKSVMFSLQTLVNAGMDDAECLRAAWEAPVIVEALDAVSRLRGKSAAKTHGLLCIFETRA